jgi:hypothetical protein
MNTQWNLDNLHQILWPNLNTYYIQLMRHHNVSDPIGFLLKNELHSRYNVYNNIQSITRTIEINPHNTDRDGSPVNVEQVEYTIHIDFENNFLQVYAVNYDLAPNAEASKVFFPINHPIILQDPHMHFMNWLNLPFLSKMRGFNDMLEYATMQYARSNPHLGLALEHTDFNTFRERRP